MSGARSIAASQAWTTSSVRRVAIDPAAKGDLVMFQTAAAASEREHRRWLEAKAEARAAAKRFTIPEPEIIATETVEGFYPALVLALIHLPRPTRPS